MNTQHKRVSDAVLHLSPLWEQRMGLAHFRIEHKFIDAFFWEDEADDFRVTATCEARWNYLQATVKWYLPSAVRHDERTLEEILVHELCHVLLSPEQSLIDIELERVAAERSGTSNDFDLNQVLFYERMEQATEQVARSILKAWQPGQP